MDALEGQTTEPDTQGILKVFLDNNAREIVVEHYKTWDSPATRLVGKKAMEICKRMVDSGLVSNMEHAAYLGYELRGAELALEKGLRYEQGGEIALPVMVPNTGLAAEATYVKAGKMVSIPDKNHDENVKVNGIEMSFKDLLKSRGLCRAF
jgi:hypothetical protein